MDSSSSAQNSEVFKESVNELFDSIIENNPNIELKVGVIRFRGRAHDAVAYLSDNTYKELVLYDDESKSFIEGALNMTEADIKAAFGSGSNTHGGIDIANEWLKADEDVPDDHKYVVLLITSRRRYTPSGTGTTHIRCRTAESQHWRRISPTTNTRIP